MSSDFSLVVERVTRIHTFELEMMQDRGYDIGENGKWVLSLYNNINNEIERLSAMSKHIEYIINVLGTAQKRRGRHQDARNMHIFALDALYKRPDTNDATLILHTPLRDDSKFILMDETVRLMEDADPKNSTHPALYDSDGNRNEPTSVIFMLGGRPAPKANELFKRFTTIPSQIFLFKETITNPTRHALTPKYEHIRDKKRIIEIVGKNKLGNLPKIMENDPIARYFGARPSELVIEYSDTSFLAQMVPNHVIIRVVSATVS